MAPETTSVFYFAQKAPKGCVTRDDQTALEALEQWKILQDHWCEHKPSATINVKEEEWLDVGAWVYSNFDSISGISFLPYDGGSYKQAPYQELSKEEYDAWIKAHPQPDIKWELLQNYEQEDNTTGSQEFACSAGVCEVVNIGSV